MIMCKIKLHRRYEHLLAYTHSRYKWFEILLNLASNVSNLTLGQYGNTLLVEGIQI